MYLGVGTDRDLKINDIAAYRMVPDAGYQLSGVTISAADSAVVLALGGIAAKCNDMANT